MWLKVFPVDYSGSNTSEVLSSYRISFWQNLSIRLFFDFHIFGAIELAELNVARPTLEDVYLLLTADVDKAEAASGEVVAS